MTTKRMNLSVVLYIVSKITPNEQVQWLEKKHYRMLSLKYIFLRGH